MRVTAFEAAAASSLKEGSCDVLIFPAGKQPVLSDTSARYILCHSRHALQRLKVCSGTLRTGVSFSGLPIGELSRVVCKHTAEQDTGPPLSELAKALKVRKSAALACLPLLLSATSDC